MEVQRRTRARHTAGSHYRLLLVRRRHLAKPAARHAQRLALPIQPRNIEPTVGGTGARRVGGIGACCADRRPPRGHGGYGRRAGAHVFGPRGAHVGAGRERWDFWRTANAYFQRLFERDVVPRAGLRGGNGAQLADADLRRGGRPAAPYPGHPGGPWRRDRVIVKGAAESASDLQSGRRHGAVRRRAMGPPRAEPAHPPLRALRPLRRGLVPPFPA
mmetsp:Transcript_32191/g.85878  ORF Transcript_32191/g.85878 Transcript_32191/m.85878 type:complete len:216 (+) Transcript_32191:1508-2155(+)